MTDLCECGHPLPEGRAEDRGRGLDALCDECIEHLTEPVKDFERGVRVASVTFAGDIPVVADPAMPDDEIQLTDESGRVFARVKLKLGGRR